MMDMENQLVRELIEESERFEEHWKDFLFNIDKLVELRASSLDKTLASAVLAAGQKYGGSGWTTGKASKTLYELSGVAIVKGDFSVYRNAFLFALAILLDVEIPMLDLSTEQAEAAYGLVAAVENEVRSPGLARTNAESATRRTRGDEEEKEETEAFGWEEPEVKTP